MSRTAASRCSRREPTLDRVPTYSAPSSAAASWSVRWRSRAASASSAAAAARPTTSRAHERSPTATSTAASAARADHRAGPRPGSTGKPSVGRRAAASAAARPRRCAARSGRAGRARRARRAAPRRGRSGTTSDRAELAHERRRATGTSGAPTTRSRRPAPGAAHRETEHDGLDDAEATVRHEQRRAVAREALGVLDLDADRRGRRTGAIRSCSCGSPPNASTGYRPSKRRRTHGRRGRSTASIRSGSTRSSGSDRHVVGSHPSVASLVPPGRVGHGRAQRA